MTSSWTFRPWLVATGLLLVLLALIAQVDTQCSCTGFESCFDSSLAVCRANIYTGLLGDSAGRVAASDGILVLLSGTGLGILLAGINLRPGA